MAWIEKKKNYEVSYIEYKSCTPSRNKCDFEFTLELKTNRKGDTVNEKLYITMPMCEASRLAEALQQMRKEVRREADKFMENTEVNN